MQAVVGKPGPIGGTELLRVIGPPDLWLAVGDVHAPQRATHTTVLDELREEQVEVLPLIFSHPRPRYAPGPDRVR